MQVGQVGGSSCAEAVGGSTGAIPKGWQCWDRATPELGVDPNLEQGFFHVVLGPPASGSHRGLIRHTNPWTPQVSYLVMKGLGLVYQCLLEMLPAH